ncbi:MAG: BREX-3 system P-loop-containing protein BrxF [Limnochordia bacterium]|nr:BREX-3 system P-loop-containing protein BrxF [Limnochordia bacterium]
MALIDELLMKIQQATKRYERLVLVVGASGSGKTALLEEAKQRTGAPLININLELSKGMLELTELQRKLYVKDLVDEIISAATDQLVLLDELDLLFDSSLEIDPLALLRSLSRRFTVVAAWNGFVKDGYLFYGIVGHPDYRRLQLRNDFVIDLVPTA